MSTNNNYNQHLAKGLLKLRAEQRYTDVILVCEGKEFHAHKILLSALSPYFDAMFLSPFLETETGRVNFPFSCEHCQNLVDFVYTGETDINSNNAGSLLEFSHIIEMVPLKEYCTDFLLKNIKAENCLSVWQFAVLQGQQELASKAKNMVMKAFGDICYTDDFQELREMDFILQILNSTDLNCPNKSKLLKAILMWINADLDSRLPYLNDLVLKVKNNFALPRSCIESEVGSLEDIKKTPEYKDLLSLLQGDDTSMALSDQFAYDECLVVITASMLCKEEMVLCFSKQQKRWFKLQTLPFKFKGYFATCSSGTNLFISGGLGNKHAVYKLDCSKNNWTEESTLPEERPRLQHRMAVCRDNLYVIGGVTKIDGNPINTIDCYSLKTRMWHEFGDFRRGKVFNLAQPVYNCNVLTIGREIMIFGGTTKGQGKCLAVQYFNTDKEYAGFLKALPEPAESGFQCVVKNDHIYIICKNGQVFEYNRNSEAKKLAHLSDTYFPRKDFGVGTVGETVVIMGGERNFKMEKDMLQLTIGSCSEDTHLFKMTETLPIDMKGMTFHTIYVPRNALFTASLQ